jgi:signal peptidase II
VKVLFISFIVLIVDQVSKLFVKGLTIHSLGLNILGLYPGQRVPVVSDIFDITFVENPGIAFGLDFGETFKLLVSLFTLIACLFLIYFLYKSKHRSFNLRLSLALILGGALGNLFDRLFYGVIYGYAPLFYGKVVDFFDIRIFNLYMFHHMLGNYIFNFADLSVTIGVILLFYAINKERVKDENIGASLEKYLAENKE